MRLVLYLGWPCALALVVALAGLHLGVDGAPLDRRLSTVSYGKFDALSACVQSIVGERRIAEAARERVHRAFDGLLAPNRPVFMLAAEFTLPADVDLNCPRSPTHYGAESRPRLVAQRPGGKRPQPSPYHLHIYVLPRSTLATLPVEPDLARRRALIEEYTIGGAEPNQVMLGITLGLYVSPDELADRTDLREFLADQLKLREKPRSAAVTAP
jgi:hypothetical protein